MVNALVSGASAAKLVGSSPILGTWLEYGKYQLNEAKS